VTHCRYCKNRPSGEFIASIIRAERIIELRTLTVTANVVSSVSILATMMMEAIISSETSKRKTNFVNLSPQANYADRAITSAGEASWVVLCD
jgi:hypothetical protein